MASALDVPGGSQRIVWTFASNRSNMHSGCLRGPRGRGALHRLRVVGLARSGWSVSGALGEGAAATMPAMAL